MVKDLFFDDAFKKWLVKEEKAFFLGKRQYLHLDPRVPFNLKWKRNFHSIFKNSQKTIGNYQFYPFIKADICTPRYKRTNGIDENGKPKRTIENKVRPIAYAAHLDSYIYSWYSTLLTELYQPLTKKLGIYKNVLAYLENKGSNIDFSKEVFDFIANKGECVALAFDISSFFDGLDHEILYSNWARVLNESRLPLDHFKVFKSLTDYTFVNKEFLDIRFKKHIAESKKNSKRLARYCSAEEFRDKIKARGHLYKNPFRNQIRKSKRFGKVCGIPQGSPISACLSNIYLIDFDISLKKRVEELGGLYRRYCDDIIVICSHSNASELRDFVMKEILNSELEINDKKTEVTIFKYCSNGLRGFEDCSDPRFKNLQYLGFEFNGQNVYIRSSSMSRYYRRLTGRIRENLKAAYGKNSIGHKVFKKKLYNRYSDKGERNFISYATNASEVMRSSTIRNQYKDSKRKINLIFKKKKEKFEEKLSRKNKLIKKML